MNLNSTHLSRRHFLKGALAAAAAPAFIPASAWSADARPTPGNRLTLGFIGVGMMNRFHLESHLGDKEVQVVAIAEIHKERREKSVARVNEVYAKDKESGVFKGCAAYNDFRELIARKDIDAVVIGTPDHWHAIPAVMAANAGKHIYCEKPMSHTVVEARAMITAARKNKIVFQTGSQQRCEFGGRFRLACELVQSGRIGKLHTIKVGVGKPARPCDLEETAVPEGTDWDMWLGPAPKRGYSEYLCPKGIHNHFPAWRDYREYAGGGLSDFGAHHFDIAQWAMNMDHSGPYEFDPPTEPTANTGLVLKYANGVTVIHGGPNGITFEGTDGTIFVDRPKIESTPESIVKEPLGKNDVHLENPGENHRRNWLDCVKTGRRPIADVEIGGHTAMLCSIANLAYEVRRKLFWNPVKERFEGDAEANKLLDYGRRAPWKLA